jgi:hypothetical protein
LNTWSHYAWRLKNDGTLTKNIDTSAGFLSNYSFVRDSLGNMYWVERFKISRFMKKTPSGEIFKIAEGEFGSVGWIYATPNGTLFFAAREKLYQLSRFGKFTVLADNLKVETPDISMIGKNYNGYGIWTDPTGNVYMALMDPREVIRVSLSGAVSTVLKNDFAWIPCSGLFDNNGDLWMLETSVTNEVRVRKINLREKPDKSAASFTPHILNFVFIAIAICLPVIFWLAWRGSVKQTRRLTRES